MINYGIKYAGFVNAPNAAYPWASAKNSTTDTSEDGYPIEEAGVNDIIGFHSSVMAEAGATPNGQPDSVANPQLLDALKVVINNQRPTYQGLWPDTGGSALKGDTYQTQVSGTPTGQYFTALQDTSVDPVGDDVNWRSVVSGDLGSVLSGTEFKHRRGTNVEIMAGVPAIGELWFNTTDNSIHMGDGVTPGGVKQLNVNISTRKFDSVQDMISSNPPLDSTCKTGKTEWVRVSNAVGDISDFSLLSQFAYVSDWSQPVDNLSITNDLISKGFKVALSTGSYDFSALPNGEVFGEGDITFTNRKVPLTHVSLRKSIDHLRIDRELPVRTPSYDTIVADEGYSFMSPQSIGFLDASDLILIQYYGNGGSPRKVWYAAYNFKTWDLVSEFAVEALGSEGFAAVVENGFTYIVQSYGAASSRTTEVFQLPLDLSLANMNTYQSVKSLNTNNGTIAGHYGDSVIFEVAESTLSTARDIYYKYSLTSIINDTSPAPIGSVVIDSSAINKLQGVGLSNDKVYAANGGRWQDGVTPIDVQRQALSIHICGVDGSPTESIVSDCVKWASVMQPFVDSTINVTENEGVAVSRHDGTDRVYAGYVAGDKFLLCEHNCYAGLDSIDLTPSKLNSTGNLERSVVNTFSGERPFNRKTNTVMTSWEEIIEYMVANKIFSYTYYNNSATDTTDIDGVFVEAYTRVTISTGNFLTFYYEVFSNNISRTGAIAGSTGSRSQSPSMLFYVTAARSFRNRAEVQFGENGDPSFSHFSNIDSQRNAAVFIGGTSGTTAGSINFTATATKYLTTSDPRTKTDFKKVETGRAWEDFGAIYDAFGEFEFKVSTGKKVLGFNAHKLLDAEINAASEGEGPRELDVGDVYAVEQVETPDGLIDVERKVTPAGVDEGKLVPYLIEVIHDLNERLKKLER